MSQGVSTAGNASAGARAFDPVRLARLENSLRAIEDGLRESERDRWDPDYIVQQVGTDPQLLFEWVRENTYWIPYHGLLRGPVGVLNDRLGNSLDRAVLLATLLQKAGHNVRLAHRELGHEAGFELAFEAATASSPDEAPADVIDEEVAPVEDPGAELQAIAARYQLDPAKMERTLIERAQTIEALTSDLDARVTAQAARLIHATDNSAAAEEWLSRFDAAMSAVRDHWWVQRQDGEKWIDFDVLPPQTAGKAATPPEYVFAGGDRPTTSRNGRACHRGTLVRRKDN